MSENGSGSDWISVFFIIIAGLVSLFQALVKKKRQSQPPTVVIQQEGDDVNEDTFEQEYESERDIVERYPNTFEKEYSHQEESADSIPASDYYQPISAKTIATDVEDIDTLLHNTLQPTPTETVDFNLKEAIIYSEILKRKY